jgi:hypothetical protein
MVAAAAVDSCCPHTIAQGKLAGLLGDRFEARIGFDELRQTGHQVRVGVQEIRHALSV